MRTNSQDPNTDNKGTGASSDRRSSNGWNDVIKVFLYCLTAIIALEIILNNRNSPGNTHFTVGLQGINISHDGLNSLRGPSDGNSQAPSIASVAKAAVSNGSDITGIDIGQQDSVQWNLLDIKHIRFAVMNATDGGAGTDRSFARNWTDAPGSGVVRGAYHFYRAKENAVLQANLFLKTVNLGPADLPPILAVVDDSTSPEIPDSALQFGVSTWLTEVEHKTHRKPIILTTKDFWDHHMTAAFGEYPLWLFSEKPVDSSDDSLPNGWRTWTFWRLRRTEVKGVAAPVSTDVFNGTQDQLHDL